MKNLALKLLAFQKEIGAIPKDEVNPFFKSKYADINTYIEVVKPILSKHGLVLLQPLSCIENKPALLTMLIDSESGEKLDLLTALPENADPQKMGAIITYFRRYAIQSMLCLQAEDDDGNAASGVHAVPAVKPSPKPPQAVNNDEPFPTRREKIEGEPCFDCGIGKFVKSPTKGTIFCSDKCWLNNK